MKKSTIIGRLYKDNKSVYQPVEIGKAKNGIPGAIEPGKPNKDKIIMGGNYGRCED
jgi:hypothetical protein